MTHRFHAVYELGGESLNAAETLLRVLVKWDQANPVDWQGKDLHTIRTLSEQNSEKFLQAILNKTPHLAQALGLTERAVQIRGFLNGLPRAYSDSPACYRSPARNGKYYLYCPIDYQGRHFAPQGATLLSEAAAEQVGYGLWGGGWLDPITVFQSTQSGTAIPADFDPAKHHVLKWNHLGDDAAKPYAFFKAAGETLRLLDGQKQAEQKYSKAINHLFHAIDGLKEKLCQAGAIHDTPTADSFNFSYTLGTDAKNRPQLEIAARKEHTGELLPLLDSKWLILSFRTQTSQYFEPNPATPEGQALQCFFDAIPDNPHNTGFPQALLSTDNLHPVDKMDGLFGPLNKPLIRDFADGIYLAYRTPADGSGTFTPPGAIPVSHAEFLWREADEADRNLGITLPPKPTVFSPPPKPQP